MEIEAEFISNQIFQKNFKKYEKNNIKINYK